ncbi:MAG: hypothetical protein AAFR01_12570, partial [Pseudomonadota bacterium]
ASNCGAVAGSALAATAATATAAVAPAAAATKTGFAERLSGASGFARDRLAAVTGRASDNSAAERADEDDDDLADVDADDDANPMLVDIAGHLVERAEAGVGFRTMVVGDSSRINPVEEAVELATLVAGDDLQVVLIDCSNDGVGQFDLPDEQPGFTDLISGQNTFDEVITNLEGSSAHFIACGGEDGVGTTLDPDSANLVLDALDEAYDHIIVVGDYGSARSLFELIQGRFDAGITVSDARRRVSVLEESENSFLGFEVTDIDVIRYERTEGSAFATRRLELGSFDATVQR